MTSDPTRDSPALGMRAHGGASAPPAPAAEPPAWAAEVDRVLSRTTREVPLIASATPRGGMTRADIVAAFTRGDPQAPRWEYKGIDRARADELARGLEALAEATHALEPAPLAKAYAARARELALEARLASEVGTAGFAGRARARFLDGTDAAVLAEAHALAAAWVSEEDEAPAPLDRASDHGPGSLAARLREEIGRRRLAFRVVVAEALAPLAATGDGTIWVAANRTLSRDDVERTTLHEIEGHAVPRARATSLAPGLFALGTARGVDDQEGLALLFEERHGFLRGARRSELALRHRAVEAMDAGGTFVDVVRLLVSRDGAAIARVVAAAERAFRGSSGEGPGLGRERVYLAAYVRVVTHLRAHPMDERVLASGQVAVDAIDALARYVT